MPTVLVLHDDRNIGGMPETYLGLEGFDALTARKGCDALHWTTHVSA